MLQDTYCILIFLFYLYLFVAVRNEKKERKKESTQFESKMRLNIKSLSQALYEKLLKTMIRRLACSTAHEKKHTFHHLSRWSETCLSSSAKDHSLEACLH